MLGEPGTQGRAGAVLTDQGVEGGVGADSPHLVDGLEGQDVLLVLRAAQRAAGTAARAQVPRGEGHRAASCQDTTAEAGTSTGRRSISLNPATLREGNPLPRGQSHNSPFSY